MYINIGKEKIFVKVQRYNTHMPVSSLAKCWLPIPVTSPVHKLYCILYFWKNNSGTQSITPHISPFRTWHCFVWPDVFLCACSRWRPSKWTNEVELQSTQILLTWFVEMAPHCIKLHPLSPCLYEYKILVCTFKSVFERYVVKRHVLSAEAKHVSTPCVDFFLQCIF